MTQSRQTSCQEPISSLMEREIDQLIAILLEQAKIPASLLSPENQKLEEWLRRVLNKYFNALSRVIPWHEIEILYNRYVEED